MFGCGVPQSAFGAGCTANAGMRTPFSPAPSLPPSLPPPLLSLWTTPKQEVHFFFVFPKIKTKQKKNRTALVFTLMSIQKHKLCPISVFPPTSDVISYMKARARL